MDMGEGDMEMVNIYDLTILHHARVQCGRCKNSILLKKGFLPELDFSQHRTHGGGEGIGSSKSSCAASIPETFDALKTCELLFSQGKVIFSPII